MTEQTNPKGTRRPPKRTNFKGLKAAPPGNDLKQALTTLLQGMEEDMPRISYSYFVREFLPLLATPPELDEEGYIIERDISRWVDIAKHPSNRVLVVDDEDHNKVIVTVPPVVGGFNTVIPVKGRSMYEVATQLDEERHIHAAMAERNFDNEIQRRFTRLDDKYDTNIVKQWNDFIVAEGYPPLSHDPSIPWDGTVEAVQTETVDEHAPMVIEEDDIEDI